MTSTPPPTPFIAHWENNHFVVVERIGRRHVHIVDPAIGRRRLNNEQFAEHATGVVLLFERGSSPTAQTTAPPPAPLRPAKLILYPLIRRHRARLAFTVLMSALLTILGLTVPAATALITNTLAAGGTPPQQWLLVAGMLAGTMGVLALIRGLGAAVLQRQMSKDLTTSVARRMFESSFRYFERRSTGDLFMRIASADMIRELLGVALVGSLLDTVLAGGYLTVLFFLTPVLAGATAAILLTQLVLVLLLAAQSRTRRREELLAGADADSLIVDAIAGVATIRTCAAENTVLKRWSAIVERRLGAAARRSRTAAVMEAVTTTSRLGAPIVFLLVAAAHSDSPGAALGLAALAGSVLAPMTSLSARLVSLGDLKPLLERILDVMNAPREPGSNADQSTGKLIGEIELINTGFRYDTRSPMVFSGLDVKITPGMKVAVVGSSGCGKSTLVSLLTGLHEPTAGRVLFDGQDITSMDLPGLRRQIGVVLQDPYLGIGTIREAITLGRPEVTDEDIFRAARMAAVHEEILAMPMGYDTRVGEGGRGVSGGQRQRIALARALVGSPAILIFDEATSALDVATEACIEQRLRAVNMTRVVIAHRLSTIADADLVLVLNDGQLAEIGPPATLIAQNGMYAAMVSQQAGESPQSNLSLPTRVLETSSSAGRHRAVERRLVSAEPVRTSLISRAPAHDRRDDRVADPAQEEQSPTDINAAA